VTETATRPFPVFKNTSSAEKVTVTQKLSLELQQEVIATASNDDEISAP
jgi:hypothetical protein